MDDDLRFEFFDPAIHLHSEPNLPREFSSDPDTLDALHILHEEAIAKKTKRGIVIQHRLGATAEAIRSEEDYILDTPCSKHPLLVSEKPPIRIASGPLHPSSRPSLSNMPLSSSPVAYPPSSSPSIPENRKRSHAVEPLGPTKRRLLGNRLPPETAIPKFCMPVGAVVLETPSKNFDVGIENIAPRGPFVEDVEESQDTETFTSAENVQEGSLQRASSSIPVRPTDIMPRTRFWGNEIDADLSTRTTCGKRFLMRRRAVPTPETYERLIARRSETAPAKAEKSYYGIEIHNLINEANKMSLQKANQPPILHEQIKPSVEQPSVRKGRTGKTMMWTEKYRARKFTDLVGDERTHRSVLKWLKGWDPIVFPGAARPKQKSRNQEDAPEERTHRKILLITGPPGLCKTTLAHVCAKQAGYEVVEINASDERSRDVVKGRIKDCVGTENVRGVNTKDRGETVRKAGKPICLVVDEVDGVVGGCGGGGEGGFIKALIDLIALDQKNSTTIGHSATSSSKRSKKGDLFRLLRPMILICNDVYHPSLKPLRSSNLAEIIHIHKPPLDKVIARMKTIFDRECVGCDKEGVRRLCEASWGINSRRESRSSSSNNEGDMRSVLVIGEWVATKLRVTDLSCGTTTKLTKQWVEQHLLESLLRGGSGSRGLGRGGAKEATERVFLEGAGFPRATPTMLAKEASQKGKNHGTGVAESSKRIAMDRLREVIDSSGETERIMTDCFTSYPSQPFQDDNFLSKPNAAYDWLHFHDALSSKVFSGQEWELNPYLSQPILGFHHLFASPAKHAWGNEFQNKWTEDQDEEPLPFTGPRADFSAHEAEKASRFLLQQIQSCLSVSLLRSFRSPEDLATDLIPQILKMLSPEVKPIIIGGSGENRGTASVRRESEKQMVQRSVVAMNAVGVTFERARIEDAKGGFGGFLYRMEPPIDTLSTFQTALHTSATSTASAPTRYAVRQVLDQEFQKYIILQREEARKARYTSGNPLLMEEPRSGFPVVLRSSAAHGNAPPQTGEEKRKADKAAGLKRDFFGRIVKDVTRDEEGVKGKGPSDENKKGEARVWVSYHEGFSMAVRKPVGLAELMRGL
ncbi:MAG: hypothetical protein MMC33_005962 [Icmadophila ericetorum]|nr:hypothetical protein [Icmadophila ericetorum]